jgi:hypothetical protein
MVSCFRSGGSISVPRTSTHNANSLLPKLPEGDTSARDEMRQRLKFGFTKVKAVNRFKKVTKAASPPHPPSNGVAAALVNAGGVARSIVKKQVMLPELKCATIQEIDEEDSPSSSKQSSTASDCLNFNPLAGLYGVVEMMTHLNGAMIRLDRATKPKIRLGTGFVEEKDVHSVDVGSDEVLERSRLDESGLRCSFDEAMKLKTLQGTIADRRQARAMRRTSREEEVGVVARRQSVILAEELEREPPAGKCRKHSRCHCFLFSFENVEFYAVGNGNGNAAAAAAN